MARYANGLLAVVAEAQKHEAGILDENRTIGELQDEYEAINDKAVEMEVNEILGKQLMVI